MDELVMQGEISTKILTMRGQSVILDRDIAALYGVETKRLNEQVRRNSERFPSDFMFQLTEKELENWKSQFATSNKEIMGLRKMSYALVGVHPCVYPSNMHKDEIWDMQPKGLTHGIKGQTHGSAPTEVF